MKKITVAELKNIVCSEFGLTVEQMAERSQSEVDAYGCNKEFKSGKGFSVRYVSNSNFCGGVANGYGVGLYVRLQYVGMVKDIKIA
jgi:hypothetical protein